MPLSLPGVIRLDGRVQSGVMLMDAVILRVGTRDSQCSISTGGFTRMNGLGQSWGCWVGRGKAGLGGVRWEGHGAVAASVISSWTLPGREAEEPEEAAASRVTAEPLPLLLLVPAAEAARAAV